MLLHQHSSCWISCGCNCSCLLCIKVGGLQASPIQLVRNQCKCLHSCHSSLCISIIWVLFYLWSPQSNDLVCMKAATPVLTSPRPPQERSMIVKACQLNLALLTLPVFRLSRGDSKVDLWKNHCQRPHLVDAWCSVHSIKPVLQQPVLPGFGGKEVPTAMWAGRRAQLQPLF